MGIRVIKVDHMDHLHHTVVNMDRHMEEWVDQVRMDRAHMEQETNTVAHQWL